MKLGGDSPELDAIDLQIISILQEHGRIPLVKLGEQVGLSAPSVIERVKKLEDGGIIIGYHAAVDATRLGKDVTAFIGVSIAHPKTIIAVRGNRCAARRRARMPSHHRRAHADDQGQNRQHFVARAAHQHDPLDRGSGADGDDGGAVDAYRAHEIISSPPTDDSRRAGKRHGAIATARSKTASARFQKDVTMHQLPQHPPAPGPLRSRARARRVRRRLRRQHQGRALARHRAEGTAGARQPDPSRRLRMRRAHRRRRRHAAADSARVFRARGAQLGFALPARGEYGVGQVFLPLDRERAQGGEAMSRESSARRDSGSSDGATCRWWRARAATSRGAGCRRFGRSSSAQCE